MTDVPTRSPRLPPVFTAAAGTHVGLVRSVNEDAVLERGDIGLFLVADGVGGAAAGDWASQQVVETFRAMPAIADAPAFLAEAQKRLEQVNATLIARGAENDGQLIATTVVVLLVQGWNYTCLWMGDSRAYLLRAGEMTQLTRDHSEMQEYVDAGVMTPEEARRHPRGNVITRALGAAEVAEVDRVSGLVHPGDQFLLCTDGLSKMLTDDEIHALLADPDQANLSASLIAGALAAGGHDNVSVVVVRCDTPAAAETSEVGDAARG
jgi:serine/threonine protein phosphatase PrpC